MNPSDLRNKAVSLLNTGNFSQASEYFNELIRQNNEDVDAWYLLGATHGQLGSFLQAEECFRRAVELAPKSHQAWDNLGVALRAQNKSHDAEECHRHALELSPNHLPALINLGISLNQKNSYQDALRYFERALSQDPASVDGLINISIALTALGKTAQAIDSAKKALTLAPNNAIAHHALADSHFASGKLPEALKHYETAIKLNPRLPESLHGAGCVYEQLNHIKTALEYYNRALSVKPDFLPSNVSIARVLIADGELEKAESVLNKVFSFDPDNVPATLELTNIHIQRGLHEDAFELLTPLLDADSVPLHVASTFARIAPKLNESESARELLEHSLESHPSAPGIEREGCLFALAKLNESLGDYDKAFDFYRDANNIWKFESDIDLHKTYIDRIINSFSKQNFGNFSRSNNLSDTPVFIIGMPRSGTSLIEQIISSHPEAFGAGEITRLWDATKSSNFFSSSTSYPEEILDLDTTSLTEISEDYLSYLSEFSPQSKRITDKLPHNFLHLGFIRLLFPKSRIIHCTRSPLDTCFSIYAHRFNTSHLYARSLKELGEYYAAYSRLMDHWKQALNIDMLEVEYETLAHDPESTIKTILDYLDLAFDDSCLNFHSNKRIVSTPSFEQVRRPIYTSSIGRWRNFERHIAPLVDALNSGHVASEQQANVRNESI